MNRAFLIILIPVILVAAGYVVVFRFMEISPGYPRLVVLVGIFSGAIYWLARRQARKPETSRE